MNKVSIFSNGHRDEYKGNRDVKAGWMIVGPQGDIHSGHSQDETTAKKTALNNCRYMNGAPTHWDKPWKSAAVAHQNAYAREAGFKDQAAAYADYQAKLAAFRAQCRIEVVSI